MGDTIKFQTPVDPLYCTTTSIHIYDGTSPWINAKCKFFEVHCYKNENVS